MSITIAGDKWRFRLPPDKVDYLFFSLLWLGCIGLIYFSGAMWEVLPLPVIYGLDINENPWLQFTSLYFSLLLIFASASVAPTPSIREVMGSRLQAWKQMLRIGWWAAFFAALIFYLGLVWIRAPWRSMYSASSRINVFFIACTGAFMFAVFLFFFELIEPIADPKTGLAEKDTNSLSKKL